MSPYRTNNANVFAVNGSNYPGYLSNTNVNNTDGVVRLSNFSLIKFFHNLVYCRKSLRETNIIHCLLTKKFFNIRLVLLKESFIFFMILK